MIYFSCNNSPKVSWLVGLIVSSVKFNTGLRQLSQFLLYPCSQEEDEKLGKNHNQSFYGQDLKEVLSHLPKYHQPERNHMDTGRLFSI